MIKVTEQSKHFMELTTINPLEFIEHNIDKLNGDNNVIRVNIHNKVAKISLYTDKLGHLRENLVAETTVACDKPNACCDYYLSKDGENYLLEFVLEKLKKLRERVMSQF